MSYDTTILADSPLVYFKLEDSSTTAADSSGNALDGTINGSPSQQQPGPLAQISSDSILFDGVDDYVVCGSDATIDDVFDGGGAVEFWVKMTTLTNGEVILSKLDSSSTDGWQVEVANVSGDTYDLMLRCHFSTTDHTAECRYGLQKDTWHHVVVNYENTAGEAAQYFVDAGSVAAIDATPSVGTRDSDAAVSLNIGRRTNVPTSTYFTGYISRVALYDSKLSVLRINEHYESGRLNFIGRVFRAAKPGPVAYWTLDEASGDALDASGNGYDLTPQGTPTRLVETPIFDNAGSGVTLDGSTDYFKLTTADWRSSDTAGTVIAFIRPDNTGVNNIFASADTAVGTNEFNFYVSSNKVSLNTFESGDATHQNTLTSDITIPADKWSFVGISSSGSAYKVWINGRSVAFTVGTGSDNGAWYDGITGRDNITVGAREANTTNYFDGSEDEVMVFDYELSAEQMLHLYEAMLAEVHAAAIEDVPYALVPMDDADSTTQGRELSANALDVTYNNTPTFGVSGPYTSLNAVTTAVQFDGSTEYATVGAVSDFVEPHQKLSFTLMVWVKFDDHTADAQQTLCSSTAGSADKGFYFGYDNRVSSSSPKRLRVYISDGTSLTTNLSTGTNDITDDNWHQVGLRSNGTNIYIYVDGAEVRNTAMGSAGTGDAAFALALGRFQSVSPGQYLDGTLAGFQYYDSDLGAIGIKKHYWAGISRYIASVARRSTTAHYRLNETSGTTAADVVGGNDDTYKNTPTLDVEQSLVADTTSSSITCVAANSEYVELPVAVYQNWADSDEFTINGWVKVPASTPGTSGYSAAFVGNSASDQPVIYMSHSSAGYFTALVRQTASATQATVQTVSDADWLDGWHMFTLTWGETDRLRFYIDGVAQGLDEVALTFATTDFSEGNISAIGPAGSGSDGYSDNTLAEFSYIDERLEGFEIYEIFKASETFGVNGADITVPVPDLDSSPLAMGGGLVPVPGITAAGGKLLDAEVPVPTLAAYGAKGVNGAVPVPTLASYGRGSALLDVPAPTIVAEAGPNSELDATVPVPALVARLGVNTEIDVPTPALAAEGTAENAGGADIAVPVPSLLTSGIGTGFGTFSREVPVPTLVTATGAVLRSAVPVPALTGSGDTDNIGRLSRTLPRLILVASGDTDVLGSSDITVPVPTLLSVSNTVSILVPVPVLVARGTVGATVTYDTVTVNLATGAVTQYDHWNFDDMVRLDGEYFGFNTSGAYQVTGTTADGSAFDATLKSSELRFGTNELKRVYRAYISYEPSGDLLFKLYKDGREQATYRLADPGVTELVQKRLKLSRGPKEKAKYWAFEIETVSGSDLDLDAVWLLAQRLGRRFR